MKHARKLLMQVAAEVRPLLDILQVGGATTAEICAAAERARAALADVDAALAAPGKTKRLKYSERGYAFADWFRSTLAADVRLSSTWRDQWAQCFDLMLLLDARTDQQIAAVCKWARAHDFWKANFQTPLKLRQRKDGVMYFDRFAAAMKSSPARRAPQARGYEIAPGRGPRAVSAMDLLKKGER